MTTEKKQTFGEGISAVLNDMCNAVLEKAVSDNPRINFTDEGFFCLLYMYHTALGERMYDLQELENMPLDDRIAMAESLGKELRSLIKKYTDIDTFKLIDELYPKK